MTDIVWRRVRAGEYESEAGRVWLSGGYTGPGWLVHAADGSWDARPTLREAKAACERAYRERVAEGER